MTFTRLVTKCVAFLSVDDDHYPPPLDHCAVCQKLQHQNVSHQIPAAAAISKSSSNSSKSSSASAHLLNRCGVKAHHEPKEAKVKKATTNWKLNCAKLISGAKSTCSSSSSSSTSTSSSSTYTKNADLPQPASPTTATTCGSAEFQLNDHHTGSTQSAPPAHHLLVEDLFNFPAASANHLTISEDDTSNRSTTNEDCDEAARLQRAREIKRGVEPPPGYLPMFEVRQPKDAGLKGSEENPILGSMSAEILCINATLQLDGNRQENGTTVAASAPKSTIPEDAFQLLRSLEMPERNIVSEEHHPHIGGPTTIHSQVDFMHCLVPDLKKITSSCFYWGKMDRYEAERLLDGKPEGTFLLRDSAQEEFLFSVSFRKYGRSLHARIEQFNHMFSFDCHDPAVATSPSVTGLLEHYKNPQRVMFFEPALTLPLNRNFCFSLQQLCRASIVSQTSYTGIASLTLPVTLKSYLKEYHYKQRVRTKRYDD